MLQAPLPGRLLLSSCLLPSCLLPSCLLPSSLLPSCFLPSCLLSSCLPSCFLPSCLLPSYLLHSSCLPSCLLFSCLLSPCLLSCLLLQDLGKCDVSDLGLKLLSENCPNLKKLSVKSCTLVTDGGVEAVSRYCRGLQHLNIQVRYLGHLVSQVVPDT